MRSCYIELLTHQDCIEVKIIRFVLRFSEIIVVTFSV